MSGRDQASVAGERSSVLVSPSTRKTTTLIVSERGVFEVNHSAEAHESIIYLA